MNKIVKWTPIDNIPQMLYIEKIIYGTGGLRIFLKESSVSDLLLIEFKPYLGFRIFDESYRLRTISENEILTSTLVPSSLFVSDDCEIIDWLRVESYDVIDSSRNIKNYIISTMDEIAEVVSEVPPVVKWVKAVDDFKFK